MTALEFYPWGGLRDVEHFEDIEGRVVAWLHEQTPDVFNLSANKFDIWRLECCASTAMLFCLTFGDELQIRGAA